jgi:MFS family permease
MTQIFHWVFPMTKELAALLATVFLLAVGMSFTAPLIPLLMKSCGATTAAIGQIQTTYFIAFTLATSLLGRWIERAGSKRMILCGLALFGASLCAMPYLPSLAWFYLIRIAQGIGSALLFAPTEAAINAVSPPERRSTNMGLYGLVFGVGFAAGPVIGTSLWALNQAAPFLAAALSCAAAIAVLQLLYHEHQVPISRTEYDFFRLISVLKIPLTAAACYAVVEISIASFLSLYLDRLGFGGARLGMVFTLFAIGAVLSPFPAGRLADRFGKQAVLKACGVLLVCTTVAFTFFHGYWAICGLICCVGIVAGALYPVSLALIGDLVPPEKFGTANASFSFFYGLGSIAGPLVTGWVLELTSIMYLFYPLAAAALAFTLVTASQHSSEYSPEPRITP